MKNKLFKRLLTIITIIASICLIGCTKTIVVEPEPEIVIEESEVVEPINEEPIVEELNEINPRDYKAVYGYKFNIPIYTEEEIADAKERMQEQGDYLELPKDYYICKQDIIYQLYDTVKDVDYESLLNNYENYSSLYFYDENTQCVYRIRDFDVSVFGCINNDYIYLHKGNGKEDLDLEKIKIPNFNGNLVLVAPHCSISVLNNETLEEYYNNIYNDFINCDESCDYTTINVEEFIKYGYKPTN